jgi:DNA-binding IscR family transcriptional regulator
MTECSEETGLCEQESNCDLRGNWQRISQAVRQALEQVSLAEMSVPLKTPRGPLEIAVRAG